MVRGVLLAVLMGCQGEQVQSGAADTGSDVTADASKTDSSADTPTITDDCGTYSGGKMVRIGKFCIDQTEVTRGEYLPILAVARATRNAPDYCAWNTTDDPAIDRSDTALDEPIGYVNFCDAATYCAWRGKRLCGKLGGGSLTLSEFNNAATSEWFSVCSANGTQTFAYPGAYDGERCWVNASQPAAVHTKPGCSGATPPYSNVFDMTGNVLEWEASCETWPPAKNTQCRLRGGFCDEKAAASCATNASSMAYERYAGSSFRCCKDAP